MPADEKEPHLWALEHDEQQLAVIDVQQLAVLDEQQLAPRPASLQAALIEHQM